MTKEKETLADLSGYLNSALKDLKVKKQLLDDAQRAVSFASNAYNDAVTTATIAKKALTDFVESELPNESPNVRQSG